MHKRSLPHRWRRQIGVVAIVAALTAPIHAAWAKQPSDTDKGRPILVDIRVTATGSQSYALYSAATEYVVRPGESPSEMHGRPLDFVCVPFRLNFKAPDGVDGDRFLLECKIRYEGQIVLSPSLIARDGKWATADMTDPDSSRHYRIEVNASTSDKRIAAARKANPAGH
jgi:hypothetical protein